MRHRSFLNLAVLLFLILAGSLIAYAEVLVQTMAADVSFEFAATDKVFAPGTYQVERNGLDSPTLKFRAGNGTEIMTLPVLSRLKVSHVKATDADTYLVFDVFKDKKVLSEVWFPHLDGFIVSETTEPHQHTTVKGKKM